MKKLKNHLLLGVLSLFFTSVIGHSQTLILDGNPSWKCFNLSLITPTSYPSLSNLKTMANYVGMPAGWEQSGFNDATWSNAVYPYGSIFTQYMWVHEPNQLVNADQVYGALFRKSFNLTSTSGSYYINFNPDNYGEIYINGNQLGGLHLWNTGSQKHCIPKSFLKVGTNVIAIKCSEASNRGTAVTFKLYHDATTPSIALSKNFFCNKDPNFNFIGGPTPIGGSPGIWSGNGISSGGLFNPSLANLGPNIITYTEISPVSNCPTSVSITVTVDPCCSDTCYWKTSGNNIIGGFNKFGTTSNDDIEIITNNINHSIIAANGQIGFGTPTINGSARMEIKENSNNGNLDLTGNLPFLKLYNNNWSTDPSLNILLPNTPNQVTPGANINDPTIFNKSNSTSIIFGNLDGSSSHQETVRIDDLGQFGINMRQSPSSVYNPTAYLHVACQGGNDDEGLTSSDVRFEDLEPGEGTILVIDKNGYVYNSHIRAEGEMQHERIKKINEELAIQVNELSKRVEQLAKQLEELDGKKINLNQSEFKIFPNPNSGSFMVKHYIPMNTKVAYLLITSQDGKEIMKKEISCIGLCTSNVNLTQNLDNGSYICTLFIDGESKKSDRFVLTK